MTKNVIGIFAQASVATALEKMTRARQSGLPVFDEAGSMVGIVSEADFLRRPDPGAPEPKLSGFASLFIPSRAAEICARAHAQRVNEIMSREVVSIDEDATIEQAASVMERRRVKRLPVVTNGKVVGIVTRADFIYALALLLQQTGRAAPVSDFESEDRAPADIRTQL
jgi:CBS domain-containing protein